MTSHRPSRRDPDLPVSEAPRLARVLFSWGDQARVECVLSGRTPPDLAVVEGLARLQLALRRSGGALQIIDMAPELEQLLALVGLGRQMRGKAESGEEPLGLEEGMEPRDAVP